MISVSETGICKLWSQKQRVGSGIVLKGLKTFTKICIILHIGQFIVCFGSKYRTFPGGLLEKVLLDMESLGHVRTQLCWRSGRVLYLYLGGVWLKFRPKYQQFFFGFPVPPLECNDDASIKLQSIF